MGVSHIQRHSYKCCTVYTCTCVSHELTFNTCTVGFHMSPTTAPPGSPLLIHLGRLEQCFLLKATTTSLNLGPFDRQNNYWEQWSNRCCCCIVEQGISLKLLQCTQLYLMEPGTGWGWHSTDPYDNLQF